MNRRIAIEQKTFSFYLIRHGESIWNFDNKFTGWTNIPLTKKGMDDAEKIGHILERQKNPPTMIYTSPLYRSLHTSSIINNHFNNKLPVLSSWRLNEKHYGTLEGVNREYIKKNYGKKYTDVLRSSFTMMPPIILPVNRENLKYPIYTNRYYDEIKNGESKKDVLSRFLPYWDNHIANSLLNDNIPLIVTHKHTARVLMKHLKYISDGEFENYKLPSKQILYITLDEQLNYKHEQLIPYRD